MDISPYLPPSNSCIAAAALGAGSAGSGSSAAWPHVRLRGAVRYSRKLAAILPRMASVFVGLPTQHDHYREYEWNCDVRMDARILERSLCGGGERFVPISKQDSIYRQSRSSCLPSQQKSSGETGKPLESAQARKKARRNDVDIRLLTTAVQHFSEDRVVVHTS